MTHLIDKDALAAEIERLRENQRLDDRHGQGVLDGLHAIEKFLNDLEVKEVDLEKEYEEFVVDDPIFGNFITNDTMGMELAKHFYELGLKVQKRQDEIKIGETEIYLEDDGGEPPYDGIQWLDLSCMEYEIPKDKFKDGDNVEIIIRKTKKVE